MKRFIFILSFLFPWAAFAQELPQPDLNGYICQNCEPFYDANAGESVRAGYVGWDLTVKSCSQTIETTETSWTKITSNLASGSVYCVKPGNHEDMGDLTLTYDCGGGINNRCWIVCTDSSGNIRTRPEPWDDDTGDRCKVDDTWTFDGADYWGVIGMWFDGDNVSNTDRAILIEGGTNESIIAYNLIEQYDVGSSDSKGIIELRDQGTADILIQYNVVRDLNPNANSEPHGIQIVEADEIRVINNQSSDGNSTFRINTGSTSSHPNDADCVGCIIENNDFFYSDDIRTNCSGTFTTSGNCNAAESTVSFKRGGQSGNANIARFIRNRVWGGRPPDTNVCCLSGGSGANLSLSNSGATDNSGTYYLLMSDNIFGESRENNVKITRSDAMSRSSFIRNVIHGQDQDASDGDALQISRCDDCEFLFNVLYDTEQSIFYRSAGSTWKGNVIINGGSVDVDSSISGYADYNAYYDSTDHGAYGTVIDEANASDSNGAPFCYWRKLLDDPERICLDYVNTTTISDHYNWANITLTATKGVNDDALGGGIFTNDFNGYPLISDPSAGPFNGKSALPTIDRRERRFRRFRRF